MYTCCPACQLISPVTASRLRARRGKIGCDGRGAPLDAPSYSIDEIPDERQPVAANGGSLPFDVREGRPEQGDRMPWVLRENRARSRSAHNGRIAFGIAAFALCIVLLGQYLWFHSVDVLQRFPDSRSWMEVLCRGTGCKIPMRRDPAGIRMMNREVRVHPEYERALLVSARLVNTLSHTQPFPRMRFMLFNVNGKVIAARTFEPKEYLGHDVEIAAGIGSRKPIQVVLDILAREEAAVSFEFMFL